MRQFRPRCAIEEGVVVWALCDQFPWWPARVCSRDEVISALKQSQCETTLPEAAPNERHLWFFNDHDSVAVLSLDYHILEYTNNMSCICLSDHLVDTYKDSIIKACHEAHTWIASKRGSPVQRLALNHVQAVVNFVANLPLPFESGPWLPSWVPTVPSTATITTTSNTTKPTHYRPTTSVATIASPPVHTSNDDDAKSSSLRPAETGFMTIGHNVSPVP